MSSASNRTPPRLNTHATFSDPRVYDRILHIRKSLRRRPIWLFLFSVPSGTIWFSVLPSAGGAVRGGGPCADGPKAGGLDLRRGAEPLELGRGRGEEAVSEKRRHPLRAGRPVVLYSPTPPTVKDALGLGRVSLPPT